jgi:hypothetical protein
VSNAGTVRAVQQTAPNPDVLSGTTVAANYAETGTNLYALCRSL